MHLPRPSEARLDPVPKVLERAREAMADQPVKAANVIATLSHNRTVRDAVNATSQVALFVQGGWSEPDAAILQLVEPERPGVSQ